MWNVASCFEPSVSLWYRSIFRERISFCRHIKGSRTEILADPAVGTHQLRDSPYQSFSTFAGNPYFIDLDQLIKEGLLLQEECDACDFGSDPRYIDYGKLYGSRFTLLKKAYTRSLEKPEEAFETFKKENSEWVGEYALYMAVKNHFNSVSWNQWDEDIRNREEKAMEHYRSCAVRRSTSIPGCSMSFIPSGEH